MAATSEGLAIIREDNVKEFGRLVKAVIQNKQTVEEYNLLAKCISWEKPRLLAQAKKKGANVNQKELYTGDSLLHYAVREGKPSMVKALVELGGDVNTKNDDGNTPLAYCSILGNIEIAKVLVSMDAHLHEPNANGMTAFHLAILYGHFFLVHYYMTLPGIEQYLENEDNVHETLKIACRLGNIETFKLVSKYVKNWEHCGKDSYTLLHYICGCGFVQIYDETIGKCINLIRNNKNLALETPLHWAVANHNVEIVSKLAEIYETNRFSLDVQNANGHTPLFLATIKGYQDIALMLHKKGGKLGIQDKNGDTVLHWAVAMESLHLVNFCVEELGTSTEIYNAMGNTPLLLACIHGNEEVAKYLLSKGANPNHKNVKSMTALHIVCIKGKYNLLKVLVSYKADIYVKDADGYCPFHYAIKKDMVEILDYLSKFAGLDFFSPNNICPEGNNMDLTILSESLEVAKHFIEKESTLHLKNQKGNLPIHTAAVCGSLNMFLFLISKGASILDLNSDGKTALELAKENKQSHILGYIKEKFGRAIF